MGTNETAAVLAQIERDQDYLIDLTRRLVQIPTVNPKFEADPEINREAELQQLLQKEGGALGLETELTEVFPGRPNLTVALPGSEERSLILNGHVDVVPVGDRKLWSVDPFGAEVRDGRLYGRGALAMKSGVALNFAVMKVIQDLGLPLEGRLELHAVVDEEAGGFGATLMVDSIGRLIERHLVLFVMFEDSELEALVRAEPLAPVDVSRAVVAGTLLREREAVLGRLRRLGVEVLDVSADVLGPALVQRYLALKRQDRL